MGRTSNKDNKTQYQICRENMGYSREKASEVLGWISADRIERIENGGFVPRSDEVLEMSRGYRNPNLCNYYCAHECPIGQQYVPEIKVKDLSRIVLEMLASLNAMQKKQERLIEITADGQISEDEMIDFTGIQAELANGCRRRNQTSEKLLRSGKITRAAQVQIKPENVDLFI